MKRLLLLIILVCLTLSVWGQSSGVEIVTPISGYYVAPFNTQVGDPYHFLLIVNTLDGLTRTYESEKRITDYPIWANTSNDVAIFAFDDNFSPDGGGIDILDDSFNLIARPIQQRGILYPMSWSQDDRSLLFTYYYTDDIGLKILDLNSGDVVSIFDSSSNILDPFIIAHIPNAASFEQEQIIYSDQNPLFPDWFITQIRITYTTNEEPEIRYLLHLTILHDSHFNNIVALDTLIDGQILVYKSMWSSNGRYAYVKTNDNQLHILTFNTEPLGWEIDSFNVPRNLIVADWLDISDLLLVTSGPAFYIAQISDGEFHLQDFFSFDFDNSDIFSVGFGDWKFTGTPEEAAQISCIFDETLPTRMEVGGQAQVAFTDGTASRLRSEPSTWGDVVQSLSEGTAFEIIGGYMCGSSYRWWQVQLADGTQGWIAEANETEYWIERRAS